MGTIYFPCSNCRDKRPVVLQDGIGKCLHCEIEHKADDLGVPPQFLEEKFVQRAAIDWLVKRYENTKRYSAVVAREEVWVARNAPPKFWGRTDGLIVARSRRGETFTASLEAKSANTWKSLLLYDDDEQIGLIALALSGLGLILAGAAIWSLSESWLLGILGPLTAAALIWVTAIVVACRSRRFQSTRIVDQVMSYPANERWVAISKDAWEQLDAPQRRDLKDQCKRRGIGFLLVEAGKPILRKRTKMRRCGNPRSEVNGFLAYYSKKARRELQGALADAEAGGR